jgi:hypothetical protein
MAEITLDFSDDGICSTPWQTKETREVMNQLGESKDEMMAAVNQNPWCG